MTKLLDIPIGSIFFTRGKVEEDVRETYYRRLSEDKFTILGLIQGPTPPVFRVKKMCDGVGEYENRILNGYDCFLPVETLFPIIPVEKIQAEIDLPSVIEKLSKGKKFPQLCFVAKEYSIADLLADLKSISVEFGINKKSC